MTRDEMFVLSRLVLIDEQRSFTDALALSLTLTGDLRVVAAEQNAIDGFHAIEAAQPDLIVADYRLQGAITGIDVARRVRDMEDSQLHQARRTPVVILTATPAPSVARQANELEAVSVFSKRSQITDIVSGLRNCVRGVHAEPAVVADPYGLSPAELEVLEHLSDGLTATAIAEDLCLSVHAIRARIRGLLSKTNSTSQLEAVTKATRAGLVVPPAFDAALIQLADTA
jgi:DNA-binding NarL/FixJ family response regulator